MNDLASIKLPQKKAYFNKTNKQANKLPALYCPWSVKLLSNVVPNIARMSEKNAEIQVGGDFFSFWQWKIQRQQKNK